MFRSAASEKSATSPPPPPPFTGFPFGSFVAKYFRGFFLPQSCGDHVRNVSETALGRCTEWRSRLAYLRAAEEGKWSPNNLIPGGQRRGWCMRYICELESSRIYIYAYSKTPFLSVAAQYFLSFFFSLSPVKKT